LFAKNPVNVQNLSDECTFLVQVEADSMAKNEAGKAVEKKIAPVEGEQGASKDAGSVEPNKNFGHGSASSGGVSSQIPGEA
jgi:hypothetical protein